VASVEVYLIDLAGLQSEPLIVQISETTAVAQDAACDPPGAIYTCPEDLFCLGNADGLEAVCTLPVVECPEAFPVEDVGPAVGGVWTIEGDSTDNEAVSVGGTCGGGGPVQIHAFTPPEAGTYRPRSPWPTVTPCSMSLATAATPTSLRARVQR
jgi:hypothetical protein